MKIRCEWANQDPLYIKYHDLEWGNPLHDDRKLFELLILEGAQAGLSWLTVLKKRKNYFEAFDGFNPNKIVRYDGKKVKALLANPGIIRNRLKVASAIGNAKAFLVAQKDFGRFDTYIWQFIGGKPKINRFKKISEIPAKTAESDAMSKDLKQRGFKFVGSTICYAFMQASGMVNDHLATCFRYPQGRP